MEKEKLQYTSENIQVLSDLDAVRQNYGVYIGDNQTPVQLLQEAVDNAIDEVTNGYSTGLEVHINKSVDDNMTYSVVDFGRGIPTGKKSVEGKEMSILEAISTRLNSGGKFNNSAYLSSAGLHGMGLCIINALSDEFSIMSTNNGIVGTINCVDGGKLTSSVDYVKTEASSGTQISFTINKDNPHFYNNQIPFEYIVEKLNTYKAFGVKGIKLFLNDTNVTETYLTVDETPFALHQHPMSNGENAVEMDITVENDKKEKFRLAFNYISSNSTSYKFFGYVNYLTCNQGGHIMAAQDAIVKAIDMFCEKRNINKPSTLASDYWIGLCAIVHCNIIKKSFASQTKDRLTTGTGATRDYFDSLVSLLVEEINKQFDKHVGIVKAIVQRISDYRQERENRKELKGLSQYITINQSEGSTVRRYSAYEKLTECQSTNRDECELIITEGDSAAGGIKRTRDKRITAVLPLKGKILNVTRATMTQALKNKEIAGIISSVGTNIFEKCNVDKIRYGDIYYAADADVDGMHITNLVIALFVTFMPAVVEAGKLKLIMSPLYIYKDNKGEWQSADSFEELPKYVQDKKSFTRLKGLGEMNDNQVKEFLLNPKKRKTVTVRMPSDIEKFMYIMETGEGKRELLTDLGILQ